MNDLDKQIIALQKQVARLSKEKKTVRAVAVKKCGVKFRIARLTNILDMDVGQYVTRDDLAILIGCGISVVISPNS